MPANAHADAVLTVDLEAIAANWRKLRALAAPALCAAVVKADAYGLGAARVARRLAAAGCRHFYVAQLAEGVALRKHVPEAEIAVLGGVAAGAEASFARHRLVPTLNSLAGLARWSAYAQKHGRQPAILHLDTGLNRLGLPAEDVAMLAAEPQRLAGLELVRLLSHLVVAEEPAHPVNAAQLERFEALCRLLPAAPRSLAASSGIFLGKPYHHDVVRPGAALYGVAPHAAGANPMAPVVALHARILQLRRVDSPMTVGYGATHIVRRPSLLATVGVGYADGYFRTLSNNSVGFVGDHPVPVVGRVSMDLVTLDVTAAPAKLVRPGAMVELLGPHRSLEQLAADAGTIAYEVLTDLCAGRRFRRRYLEGGTAP